LLRSHFFTGDQVEALTRDVRTSQLDPIDEAIAAFVEKVVLSASETTQADVDTLRAHGLDDTDIVDIVLAATARVFWSKANDAIGYEPSETLLERVQSLFGDRIFRALMVGRRFGVTRRAAGTADDGPSPRRGRPS
jgi:hypothetical protein